jgi:hypothetical protein
MSDGRRALWVAGLLIAVARTASSAPPSAADIMVRNEEANRVQDITSEATLTTGGDGASKVKTFTWWRKLGADGLHFRTLTRFHTPAEVRGEGILFEEHPDNENDVFLYLPMFKKIRRVEGQSQSSPFMGTVFNYSDIAQHHASDYRHALQRTEACPADPQVQCYVIESTPGSDTVKERTGYSRSVQWIRADNYMVARGEFYDDQGRLWKRLSASSIALVDPAAHKWWAQEVRIDDLLTSRFTVLQFAQVRTSTGIADATFSQQNLARE